MLAWRRQRTATAAGAAPPLPLVDNYLPQVGDANYNRGIRALVLGADNPALGEQTVGRNCTLHV